MAIAEWAHQCYLVSEHPDLKKAALIGNLDPVQQSTFELVLKLRNVTGAQLARTEPSERTPTAWNNRLRDLYRKRLARRRAQGREQIYFPVIEEVIIHGR